MRLISALAPVTLAAALALTACAPTPAAAPAPTSSPATITAPSSTPSPSPTQTPVDLAPMDTITAPEPVTVNVPAPQPVKVQTPAPVVAVPVTAPTAPAIPAAAPAPVRCEEDQPCWDCATMGNKICGPATSDQCQEDDPCWDCKTMGNKICGPVDCATLKLGDAWAGVGTYCSTQPITAPVRHVYLRPGTLKCEVDGQPCAREEVIFTDGVSQYTPDMKNFTPGPGAACYLNGFKCWATSVR